MNMIEATINVKDYGTMRFELDREAAPITVDNFVTLATSGFYDGLGFCRIVKGFVIQGGSKTNSITGDSDHHIKGEFLSNGVNNPLKHVKGTLSMARSQDPDSAGTQFFVMLEDAPHLDDGYAAFGTMLDGFDVLARIGDVETTGAADWNRPLEMPLMESVTITES